MKYDTVLHHFTQINEVSAGFLLHENQLEVLVCVCVICPYMIWWIMAAHNILVFIARSNVCFLTLYPNLASIIHLHKDVRLVDVYILPSVCPLCQIWSFIL